MDDPSSTPAVEESGKDNPPATPSSLLVRPAVWLAVLAIGCAVTYAFLLAHFDLWRQPNETDFGVPSKDARVWLYLQPLQVDPVNDSLRTRISVVPDPLLADPETIADRDYLLRIRRGKQVEHVAVRANQPLPEVVFDIDLDGGDIRDYPLDQYLATIALSASEQVQDGKERSLPVHVTTW